MEVDGSEIVCLMAVSAMLYKCTYCVLTLHGRKEVISMMSEYPQDSAKFYGYDYQVEEQLVFCILRIFGYIMAAACCTERECPQYGGHAK